MPERERAYLEGQLVTVLSGKVGKRGKVTIRNGFGFTQEVDGRKLERIDKSDPKHVLRYGAPD